MSLYLKTEEIQPEANIVSEVHENEIFTMEEGLMTNKNKIHINYDDNNYSSEDENLVTLNNIGALNKQDIVFKKLGRVRTTWT